MDRIQHKPGVLHKAGESLYRYSSNRVYYARVKVDGKEIKRSLRTTDPALARRNLAALREATKSSARLTNRHRGEKLFAGVGHLSVTHQRRWSVMPFSVVGISVRAPFSGYSPLISAQRRQIFENFVPQMPYC
jgi:hypothetical protein